MMENGTIGKGKLYRSASPCNNKHNRASYVDALIKEAGINCILNLADNEVKIERYIGKEDFNSPYFLSLYEDNKVIPLALNMNYMSDEFAEKIAQGFLQMNKQDGPYLVHCTEGKDRTGFVCALIEAVAGADINEIIDDYMLTYDNYYEINKEKDPEKYELIRDRDIVAMMRFICNGDPYTSDLSKGARSYLMNAGMSEKDIDLFLEKIS